MKRTMKNVIPVIVAVLLLASVTFAKSKPEQSYPLTGTVVSFHAEQEVRASDGNAHTYERRVYVVKTASGTLEVTGWEHGFRKASKRPPLSVGQSLAYRTDGKFLYTVLEDGKEHRYAIFAAN